MSSGPVEDSGRSSPSPSPFLIVLVTCPVDKAADLARTLVDESLCACVNILSNILSVYRWQGDVVSEEESLLVMKTMDNIYDRLETRIKQLHPYEVPEIISLNIKNGSSTYLDWIAGTLQTREQDLQKQKIL